MKSLHRLLIVPLFAFALSLSSTLTVQAEPETPVTVFVVRHAEKDESDPTNRNPGLSEVGTARAEDLARMLSKAGVTHVFCSEYKRTHDTLVPLAMSLDLALTTIPAQNPDEQIKQLKALPAGSVAVVAGHSNTAPGLVEGLGPKLEGLEQHPQYGPMLGHDQYDSLFVVSLPPVDQVLPSVVELRYGD